MGSQALNENDKLRLENRLLKAYILYESMSKSQTIKITAEVWYPRGSESDLYRKRHETHIIEIRDPKVYIDEVEVLHESS